MHMNETSKRATESIHQKSVEFQDQYQDNMYTKMNPSSRQTRQFLIQDLYNRINTKPYHLLFHPTPSSPSHLNRRNSTNINQSNRLKIVRRGRRSSVPSIRSRRKRDQCNGRQTVTRSRRGRHLSRQGDQCDRRKIIAGSRRRAHVRSGDVGKGSVCGGEGGDGDG